MDHVYSFNLDRFGRQDQWSGPSGALLGEEAGTERDTVIPDSTSTDEDDSGSGELSE